MALKKAGCDVMALCPLDHPLTKTNAAQQIHIYNGLVPLKTLAGAIAESKPDFILPCDDLATRHLYQLHEKSRHDDGAGEPIRALIERSLGTPECLPIVYARTAFMELAAAEGIRVPKTTVVANTDELEKCIGQMGLPIVLKANGTSGGLGVRIVHSIEEASRAFRTLHAPPLLPRALKRAVVDRDYTLLMPLVFRSRPVVNAQAFVAGREATSAIACWKGRVLASLHFEVLSKANVAGHATVLRLIENTEMSSATETIARKLNLSGVHGFDFMLEAETGSAYLIEMNPRATQVGHLTLGPGRDLPAALHAAISGDAVQSAPKLTENNTIALFPQEWIRDPRSSFLQSGYHDVPWDEPELVHACINTRQKQRGWYWHDRSHDDAFSLSASASYAAPEKGVQ
jgi:formate-dependent phosphoribosylglycinamide formyltransferase (GAR transformylase)